MDSPQSTFDPFNPGSVDPLLHPIVYFQEYPENPINANEPITILGPNTKPRTIAVIDELGLRFNRDQFNSIEEAASAFMTHLDRVVKNSYDPLNFEIIVHIKTTAVFKVKIGQPIWVNEEPSRPFDYWVLKKVAKLWLEYKPNIP